MGQTYRANIYGKLLEQIYRANIKGKHIGPTSGQTDRANILGKHPGPTYREII